MYVVSTCLYILLLDEWEFARRPRFRTTVDVEDFLASGNVDKILNIDYIRQPLNIQVKDFPHDKAFQEILPKRRTKEKTPVPYDGRKSGEGDNTTKTSAAQGDNDDDEDIIILDEGTYISCAYQELLF